MADFICTQISKNANCPVDQIPGPARSSHADYVLCTQVSSINAMLEHRALIKIIQLAGTKAIGKNNSQKSDFMWTNIANSQLTLICFACFKF